MKNYYWENLIKNRNNLNKNNYAQILELNAHSSSNIDKFLIRLKTSIAIDANSGKRAGTYYSRLFFMSDLQ